MENSLVKIEETNKLWQRFMDQEPTREEIWKIFHDGNVGKLFKKKAALALLKMYANCKAVLT